eukprot:1156404-Pelagomonas_calceolata.AAC.10
MQAHALCLINTHRDRAHAWVLVSLIELYLVLRLHAAAHPACTRRDISIYTGSGRSTWVQGQAALLALNKRARHTCIAQNH